MRLRIEHVTTYGYSLPARSNRNELRLAPEENERQSPGPLTIDLFPSAEIREGRDLLGNLVHHFEVVEKHPELRITTVSEVETFSVANKVDTAREMPFPDRPSPPDDDFLYSFLGDSELVSGSFPLWREAVDAKLRSAPSWGEIVAGLSEHVFQSCRYEFDPHAGIPTAEETRESRVGSCQEFAHLLLGYCRTLSIPARYVSGYLYDPGIDEESESETLGAGATHAWVEVHVPGVGWIGIDPTNRRWIDESYISIATGRDYFDVAPVRGNFLGGGKDRSLSVSVSVRRIG